MRQNYDASITCSCNVRYSGDGVICVDHDECDLGTDDCDINAACSNNVESFACTCNNDYSGDGVTCVDYDECADKTDNCDEDEHSPFSTAPFHKCHFRFSAIDNRGAQA